MSKLQAKDLMIGDWIMFPNSIEKIQEVAYVEGKGYCASFAASATLFPIPIDKLEPIPLTKEILENNGFVGDGYAHLFIDDTTHLQYYYHEHRLRKYYYGIDEYDNHREVKDITFQCHCYYVHELQHALKLCGIEKEVQL